MDTESIDFNVKASINEINETTKFPQSKTYYQQNMIDLSNLWKSISDIHYEILSEDESGQYHETNYI